LNFGQKRLMYKKTK